jgi:hypothetical protein
VGRGESFCHESPKVRRFYSVASHPRLSVIAHFSLSGNNNGSGFNTGVTVSGNVFGPTTFTSVAGTWTTESVSFVATGDPTTLIFSSIDPTGYSGPLLADVFVMGPAAAASVPTPAAAGGAALLAGLFVAKIRSRKNSA